MKTKLTDKQIKDLEKKYGKHNFCYQRGNPDTKLVDDQICWHGFSWCPKCGSSDLNA
jgi:hypothetical protein